MIDPWLSYFGHPTLPAGYDADDHNGDDINGAGTNWPVWPQLFDTFIALEVMFITEEMMQIFETGCPDYVVPCVSNVIAFPREERTYVVGHTWMDVSVEAEGSTIVFPREVRAQTMRKRA